MGLTFFLQRLSHCFLHDDLALGFGRHFPCHRFTVSLVLLRLRDNACLIDLADLEAFHNALNFGSVLCTGDNIHGYIISFGALISQDTVENAIALRLFGELCQVLVWDRKDLQFLAGLDHIGEPCFAFGLLFLLQHGHEKQGDILCRRACKFCGNFKAFKREPDDLLSRITAVVHSCGSPFVLIFLPLLGLHPPFPR